MLKASIAISDTSTFTLPTDGWIPGLHLHEQGPVAARAHVHRALRDVRRAQRDRARGRQLGRRHRAGGRRHHGGLRADRFADRTFRYATSKSRRACARCQATTCAAATGSSVRPIPPTAGRTGSRRRSPTASRSRCVRRTGASSARRGPTTRRNVLRLRREHRVLQPDARHVSADLLLLSAVRRRHDVQQRTARRDRAHRDGHAQGRGARPPQSRDRSDSAHQQDARRERQASGDRHQRTTRRRRDACRERRPARAADCGTRCATKNASRARASTDKSRIGMRAAGTRSRRTRSSSSRFPAASSRFSGSRSTRTAAAAREALRPDVGQVSGVRDAREVLVGRVGEQIGTAMTAIRSDCSALRPLPSARERRRSNRRVRRRRRRRELVHAAAGSHRHDHAGGSALRGTSRRRSAHRSGASQSAHSRTGRAADAALARRPQAISAGHAHAFHRMRRQRRARLARRCVRQAESGSDAAASRRHDEQLGVDRRSAAHAARGSRREDATRNGFSPRAATRV